MAHSSLSCLSLVYFPWQSDQESERQVPTADGEALARKWNSSFYETSARTGENIHEVFAGKDLLSVTFSPVLPPHHPSSISFLKDLVKSVLKVVQEDKEGKNKGASGGAPWEEKKRKCNLM